MTGLRGIGGVAAVVACLLAATAAAQAPPQPRIRAAAPVQITQKCDPARVLGVSRVADIDTSTGPRFGHQQYKENELLGDGEVVLTFDDGPLRVHTQAVVDALEAQCTKATFFMVGSQAQADPEMVKQIMRRGHSVGTHTWSHQDLRKLTPLAARQEMELGFSAVTQAAGQPIAPFFRFPFLSDTKAMKGYAESRKFGVFSIEIDALDYRNKDNPQAVHDQVMSQLAYQKKGILLFHDIQPSTAAALPAILRSMKAKGYRIVHLRPAAPATTLAEFDGMIGKEASRRRLASAGNPLANRALTNPLPPLQTLPQAGPPGAPGLPPPLPPAQALSGSQYGVPYGPPPGAEPRPRRAAEPPADDWRRRILSGQN
jgi:peptidoglycan/xylan/chitin deacetylase (PgdA/CDA1 family)